MASPQPCLLLRHGCAPLGFPECRRQGRGPAFCVPAESDSVSLDSVHREGVGGTARDKGTGNEDDAITLVSEARL